MGIQTPELRKFKILKKKERGRVLGRGQESEHSQHSRILHSRSRVLILFRILPGGLLA